MYLSFGFVFLALGIIGAFLPGVPTTIFVILAAGCFANSSPKFEAWILDHPRFGPSVRNWRKNKAMPLSAKLMASGGMAFGALSFWLLPISIKWKVSLWIVLAACLLYVWTRPFPVTLSQEES
ncbi:MAG: YbaN family protein [bacterium]